MRCLPQWIEISEANDLQTLCSTNIHSVVYNDLIIFSLIRTRSIAHQIPNYPQTCKFIFLNVKKRLESVNLNNDSLLQKKKKKMIHV